MITPAMDFKVENTARFVAHFQYVILPSTTARDAPVAEGIFPGRLCQVSYASTAKATASLASTPRPYSSEVVTRAGDNRSVSIAISVRFRAPPPLTITSSGKTGKNVR